MSPGKHFRQLVEQARSKHQPLQIVGVPNALCAQLAKQHGHQAIYLSGAGIANGCFALPDLGLIDFSETLIEAKRLTQACDLPLLVDIDTGGAQPLSIARCIESLVDAGAAGCHLEDQVQPKRCGHRANKILCSSDEMCERIQVACDARSDSDLFIMARTDAVSVEGVDAAIQRAKAYVEAGADGIFAEAITTVEDYQTFTQKIDVPVLANLTEFGVTPLLTREQCAVAGLAMLLYPLTAFRAMNFAADKIYRTLAKEGTQASCITEMQTRDALYELIDYERAEQAIDDYFRRLEGD